MILVLQVRQLLLFLDVSRFKLYGAKMYNELCYTSLLETDSEPIFVSLYPQLRTIILIDVGFIACLSARHF